MTILGDTPIIETADDLPEPDRDDGHQAEAPEFEPVDDEGD